jgi:hypothetical protein
MIWNINLAMEQEYKEKYNVLKSSLGVSIKELIIRGIEEYELDLQYKKDQEN